MNVILRSENSSMHLVRILGESKNLAHKGAIVTFHVQYINIWNHRYDFIPNREPIIARELAYGPKYRPWFRRHGKPYLLSKEAGPSFAPMQEEAPMAAPPLGQYGSTYSGSFTKPTIHKHHILHHIFLFLHRL
ncbi:hypothetical protein Godav_027974 [Gossypium davidsonii]|uniref:Uncharacterized protein n=1 Tax=Gossypium davidsonii TaxID=34287 RepID=A0A7J8RXU1_GOSDV|nr:hypothetical protein [Gossypium davidsonii]